MSLLLSRYIGGTQGCFKSAYIRQLHILSWKKKIQHHIGAMVLTWDRSVRASNLDSCIRFKCFRLTQHCFNSSIFPTEDGRTTETCSG
jgi:hypothetical protein